MRQSLPGLFLSTHKRRRFFYSTATTNFTTPCICVEKTPITKQSKRWKFFFAAVIVCVCVDCVRLKMGRATSKDAQALIHSLRSAYAATPSSLKIIDLYVGFAVFSAIIQVVYMAIVGSFPFNSFLSGVLSCIGTAVLAVCLRIQVNKENKEFKDLPSERAFADFVLCNLVLHLVIMNFLG